CLLQRVLHTLQIVGVTDGAHPSDPYALDRVFYAVTRRACWRIGSRGRDVLPAGGSGIAVVDDDGDVVVSVEHRIAYAGRQPVVPEAAITHDADGAPLCAGCVEGSRPRCAKAIAHGGCTNVEGR